MPRTENDVPRRFNPLNRIHVSVIIFLKSEYWRVADEPCWWVEFYQPSCKRRVTVTNRAEQSLAPTDRRLRHGFFGRHHIACLQLALGRPLPKSLPLAIISDDVEFEGRVPAAS